MLFDDPAAEPGEAGRAPLSRVAALRRKHRHFKTVTAGCTIVFGAFLGLSLIEDPIVAAPLVVMTAPLFALFALAPWLLRFGLPLRAAFWAQSLGAYISLTVFGVAMGGAEYISLPLFYLLPTLAASFGDERDAAASAATGGALLLATVWFGTAGSAPPPERLAGFCVLILFVGAMNVFNTAARRRAHRGLIEARRRAEAANLTKSRFLATMSHELRTPLNGVTGMTQLLLHGELSARQRKAAEVIDASALALAALLENMLDVSRIEDGDAGLTLARFDLEGFAREVKAGAAAKAAEKGLTFRCAVDATAAGAWIGDAARLRIMVRHLLDNALKFTESGWVSLSFLKAGGRLLIRVEDSGPGVAPAERDRIFERFYQSDQSEARSHGGAGLGLAIVRDWAMIMGGSVICREGAAGGGVFEIELPLKRPAASMRPG